MTILAGYITIESRWFRLDLFYLCTLLVLWIYFLLRLISTAFKMIGKQTQICHSSFFAVLFPITAQAVTRQKIDLLTYTCNRFRISSRPSKPNGHVPFVILWFCILGLCFNLINSFIICCVILLKLKKNFKYMSLLSNMYNYVLNEACGLSNTVKSQWSVRTLAECIRIWTCHNADRSLSYRPSPWRI